MSWCIFCCSWKQNSQLFIYLFLDRYVKYKPFRHLAKKPYVFLSLHLFRYRWLHVSRSTYIHTISNNGIKELLNICLKHGEKVSFTHLYKRDTCREKMTDSAIDNVSVPLSQTVSTTTKMRVRSRKWKRAKLSNWENLFLDYLKDAPSHCHVRLNAFWFLSFTQSQSSYWEDLYSSIVQ